LIEQILSYKTLFFQLSHYHELCIFARNKWEPTFHDCKNLHQWRWPTINITTAERHHPSTSLCLPPLFGFQKCSASIKKYQWVPFFPHGGIQLRTLVSCSLPKSNAIWSDCPLTAIRHMATTCNKVLVGRFTLHCPTNSNIKIEGITFGAALIL